MDQEQEKKVRLKTKYQAQPLKIWQFLLFAVALQIILLENNFLFHPDQQKIFEDIKESIKNNGMKKPLEVTIDKRGYVVEVGNQRLRALLELGITTAPCLVTKRI